MENDTFEINTERLCLRHIRQEDWESVRQIWVDFNASDMFIYDRPHDTEPEQVRARIARWAEANKGREHMFFSVCCKDKLIGYVAFNKREVGYELGYCFHSQYHGRGYAKESISVLLDYLRRMGAVCLTAGTALNNKPSVALLMSLGFELVEKEKLSFHRDKEGRDISFDGGIFELLL